MRTPDRKVALARAWSPPPAGPPLAERSERPPSTWMCSFTLASGSIVRLSTKSVPVPVGHQADGIAPFGKYRNALRSGAPVAVVAANFFAPAAANTRAGNDSRAGTAR